MSYQFSMIPRRQITLFDPRVTFAEVRRVLEPQGLEVAGGKFGLRIVRKTNTPPRAA